MNVNLDNSAFGISNFNFLNSFTITEPVLWNIFTGFFLFYIFMTLIFVYHWNRFDTPGSLILVGEVLYFIGAFALLTTAGMAVSAF